MDAYAYSPQNLNLDVVLNMRFDDENLDVVSIYGIIN